jgi:gas vesicle protein
MKNNSKILLALLAGAAAGVVAAILLAPDEGKESRKKLGQWADDVYNNSKDKIAEIKTGEKVRDRYEGADLGI